jgi:hypothetical protein
MIGALLTGVASASADLIVQPDNRLLPEIGYVASPGDFAEFGGGGAYTLRSLSLDNPSSRVLPPPTSSSVDSFFDVFAEVLFTGLPGSPFVDLVAPAHVKYTYWYSDFPTKYYSTEMLQLEIDSGGIMLYESPTLASVGTTTVTDYGDGTYGVDSFFDVFLELSFDGGQSWLPASNAVYITTVLPEPATLSLLALGGMALLRRQTNSLGTHWRHKP